MSLLLYLLPHTASHPGTVRPIKDLRNTALCNSIPLKYFSPALRQTQTRTEQEPISDGGRFDVSVNKAKKTFSLEILDMRVEDTATYYCKADVHLWPVFLRHFTKSSESHKEQLIKYVDGSGTVVTVTADSSSLVSQSPLRQTAAAGDTATFSCKYSGICQYTVNWYSQSTGQTPKYLLQVLNSGAQNKKTAAGGRISASIDPAEKISRLEISKLQLSDSAVYYCALSRRIAQ
ncbi:uncharacterized protein [Heterodontus francisci]|uniref:uncharacterized protein n=1 Tax=Heterodontus francisci TaxID=7792 RepID=UPI00355B6C05